MEDNKVRLKHQNLIPTLNYCADIGLCGEKTLL